MSNIKKLLGKKIGSIRKSRGYTQMQLAEYIGISTNALGLIETGVGFLTADTLEKLVKVLNISPSDLFAFENLTNEELLNQVLKKIELIKEDSEKLDLLNTLLSKLI